MIWFLRLFPAFRALEDESAELSERLALAQDASTSATQQLIAERSLRQAADERAERYHEQLVDALKENANWLASSMSRRPIHGGIASPEQPVQQQTPGELKEMPSKRHAREVARDTSQRTMEQMIADMNARHGAGEVPPPEGPEFTTQ